MIVGPSERKTSDCTERQTGKLLDVALLPVELSSYINENLGLRVSIMKYTRCGRDNCQLLTKSLERAFGYNRAQCASDVVKH